MARKLTVKQEAFVREYLKNGRNAVAAYKHSYDCSMMSDASIHKEAKSLTNHPLITPRIGAVIRRIEQQTETTVERVQREFERIAYADIRKAVRWTNDLIATEDDDGVKMIESRVLLVPSLDIDDDTAAAISEIAMTKEGIKIKFHSKIAALEALARIRGMFIDKTETKVIIEETPEMAEQLRYVHKMLTTGPLARPGGMLKVIDQPAANGHANGALNGKGHK